MMFYGIEVRLDPHLLIELDSRISLKVIFEQSEVIRFLIYSPNDVDWRRNRG